ncbi:hypothetical protein AgCh_031477 [Apium graveolens]
MRFFIIRGKANVVADALSKKERLKMIMSFGEFIRDFEEMEIEVKERKADDHCYLLEAIWIDLNLNKDVIMKLGKAKEVADTLKDEVVERKMLGPAVVQRTKDMIDLIRGRLVVAQDGHDKALKVIPSHPLDSPLSKEEFEIWNGSEMKCPSTREGPGYGRARGPNAARVMTGSLLLYFFITQQQLGKMTRLQQTQRKRVESVPRLPVDVVAAIAAEVDLLVDQAFYF